MRYINVSLVVLVALVLLSCQSVNLETTNISPSQIMTVQYLDTGESTHVGCGTNTSGMNPGLPTTGVSWVGYKRIYDDGTEPLPCQYWSNAVYRTAFTFDLSPLNGKHIASAVLKITYGTPIWSSAAEGRPVGSYVKSLALATATDWQTGKSTATVFKRADFLPSKPIAGLPDFPFGDGFVSSSSFPVKHDNAQSQVELSSLIRDILSGREPNLGFVLIGFDESVGNKSNKDRVSQITGITLEITRGK